MGQFGFYIENWNEQLCEGLGLSTVWEPVNHGLISFALEGWSENREDKK